MIKIKVAWCELGPRMANRFRRKDPTIKEFEYNSANDWLAQLLEPKQLITFINFDFCHDPHSLNEQINFLMQMFENFEKKILSKFGESISRTWMSKPDPFRFEIDIQVDDDISNYKLRKISKEIFYSLKSELERHLKLRAFE